MYVLEEKDEKNLCKSNKRRNNQLMSVVTNCRLSFVWGERENIEGRKREREKYFY